MTDPIHPALEVTITIPLDVLESVIATAQRLHPGNLKPRERKALAIAVREIGQVKEMVGLEP